jgi:DNA processing protein
MRSRRSEKSETPNLNPARNSGFAERRYAPPQRVATIAMSTLLRSLASTPAELFETGADTRLWYAGDLDLVRRKSVSIVGTRAVSQEGAARARRLARELSRAGVVVVSGLARGVDTEALSAAIAEGGRVIAVIGTPLDRAYPAENRRLQEKIYTDHLLVSQFAPGRRVFPSNFPERNKLMAAITGASVIIEAGETSGTLHQAAECVRLDRWLFIAKSVLDDAALHWPAKFRDYAKVRQLAETADILKVL